MNELAEIPRTTLRDEQSISRMVTTQDSPEFKFRLALRERDRLMLSAGARIDALAANNRELQLQVEKLEQSVQWYQAKLRELSLAQYTYPGLIERIKELEREEAKLTEDRDQILNDLERIRRYSPDRLPKLVALPFKLLLGGLVMIIQKFRSSTRS